MFWLAADSPCDAVIDENFLRQFDRQQGRKQAYMKEETWKKHDTLMYRLS